MAAKTTFMETLCVLAFLSSCFVGTFAAASLYPDAPPAMEGSSTPDMNPFPRPYKPAPPSIPNAEKPDQPKPSIPYSEENPPRMQQPSGMSMPAFPFEFPPRPRPIWRPFPPHMPFPGVPRPLIPPPFIPSLTVQGLVLCQDCKSGNSTSLANAAPLHGAEVKLACEVAGVGFKAMFEATTCTDYHGVYWMHVPEFDFRNFSPMKDCAVFLVRSAHANCSIPTAINYINGTRGARLWWERPLAPYQPRFAVSPLAFAAPSCNNSTKLPLAPAPVNSTTQELAPAPPLSQELAPAAAPATSSSAGAVPFPPAALPREFFAPAPSPAAPHKHKS